MGEWKTHLLVEALQERHELVEDSLLCHGAPGAPHGPSRRQTCLPVRV